MLSTKLNSLSKVVMKVSDKKLLSTFDELIIFTLLSTTSLIHKPFLLITAKQIFSLEN